MKKFYSKVFLFIAPIILVSFFLDSKLSEMHRKVHELPDEISVWNDIYSSSIQCDLAIYGSSRAWVHFDPEVMEDSIGISVYNFGIDGHNFTLQYLRHKEYFKHNKKPKIILLSLDIGSLEKNNNPYNYQQFLPYMYWNQEIKEYTQQFDFFSPYEFYLPLLRYAGQRSIIQKILSNKINQSYSKTIRRKGFKGQNKELTDKSTKSSMSKREVKMDSEIKKLFLRFIEEVVSENIQLLFVYSPEYIAGQKHITNREEILEFYRACADKYNIRFVDFSNHSISLNKNLFYNYSHLNISGANAFSKALIPQIKTAF